MINADWRREGVKREEKVEVKKIAGDQQAVRQDALLALLALFYIHYGRECQQSRNQV